jgi:hypothetical protein
MKAENRCLALCVLLAVNVLSRLSNSRTTVKGSNRRAPAPTFIGDSWPSAATSCSFRTMESFLKSGVGAPRPNNLISGSGILNLPPNYQEGVGATPAHFWSGVTDNGPPIANPLTFNP